MSETESPTPPVPEGPIPAPSLDGAVAWLNVASPISMAQLRGKVVVLDFWTYGCINCMHILRDLKTLEQRFPEELVVIGVHSPKFTNEKDTENLKRILVRYEIERPVANDAGHEIWRRYGVQAWPTRVIIDPAGNVVGTAMGEGNLEGFISAIRTVVRVFDEQGQINRAPLALELERTRHADRPLLYPGKVLADEASGRLFIADSNHNRIVVASMDVASGSDVASGFSRTTAPLIETIGSGLQGDNDGIFTQARFYRPQGLVLGTDGELYVADTENHEIRVVDFPARAVHTVAGTGKQGAWSGEGGEAMRIDLNSPWDLAIKPGILIIAMAGPHQIWVVDLLHDRVYPYAGTGEEARKDGPVNTATFAQPSGLALDGNTLYVADAEANIIRALDLPPGNAVTTIAGGDLFKFGDEDGKGDAARLQHPLGVTTYAGRLLIADTYNHKIKMLDPATRQVTTFAGTGVAGHADGPAKAAQFFEPGGLSVAQNTLYIADTNNHAIRTIDLGTKLVGTLTIAGLTPPATWSYLRRTPVGTNL